MKTIKLIKNSMKNKTHDQMTEAFITSVFLALSGGFQDAYTYIGRGNVFANAQTGNIVLLATKFYERKWFESTRYIFPLTAFFCGVWVAELIRRHYHNRPKFHWRQLVLGVEIALLFVVGFLPRELDFLANALVSFVCAMQVQSFRKVEGTPYASTMCIGNLRGGTENLFAYFNNRKESSLNCSKQYFLIILFFAIGAGLGSALTSVFGNIAIWGSCVLLTISFLIIFFGEGREE